MREFRGKLIVFEGIDGSGKTTQAELLASALLDNDHKVVLTREPGATDLGLLVRDHLEEGGLTPTERLFLFLTDRASHVDRVILPALHEGKIVVCDRFTMSTLAYQLSKAAVSYHHVRVRDYIRILGDVAAAWLKPDLTIYYDLHPTLGRGSLDYEGSNGKAVVHRMYNELVRSGVWATEVIPARIGDIDQIHERTKRVVRDRLGIEF